MNLFNGLLASRFQTKGKWKNTIIFLAEAANRNHRKIGTEQKLFFFDPVSPGLCFFLPHGTRIYNAMIDLIRQEYRRRGYDEVITPNMYKADLWKISGHWNHYSEGEYRWVALEPSP